MSKKIQKGKKSIKNNIAKKGNKRIKMLKEKSRKQSILCYEKVTQELRPLEVYTEIYLVLVSMMTLLTCFSFCFSCQNR